jgi:membrane-bound serine protease (ClpP class)
MTGLIVALLLMGFLLLLAEVFVPGLVLGILGFVVLTTGVVLSFREFGPATGAWVFVGTAGGAFLLFVVALKILPRTRVGQRILLSEKVEGGPRDRETEQERQRLLGREGTALTDLRPAGKGMIADKRWDVVSDGGYVDQGATFRVTRVEGLRIVVSPVTGGSSEGR